MDSQPAAQSTTKSISISYTKAHHVTHLKISFVYREIYTYVQL